jgi:hypothetical protein
MGARRNPDPEMFQSLGANPLALREVSAEAQDSAASVRPAAIRRAPSRAFATRLRVSKVIDFLQAEFIQYREDIGLHEKQLRTMG